jgi:hypothetical protein
MRKIFGYLRDYFRGLNYPYLLVLLHLLALAVFVNFGVYSEDNWIKADPDSLHRLLKYIAGYGVMYGGAWLLLMAFDRDRRLRSGKLWGLITAGVILFSLRAWYQPDYATIGTWASPAYMTLVYKLIINATGLVFLFIPIAVYWLIADRKNGQLYGFHAKGVVLWPYFLMIGIMLPLIFFAARDASFQDTYPRALRLNIPREDPHWFGGTMLYEAVYSFDYVVTEFFFRGFLIIPIARMVGEKAILPMCAFYVAIHFDKPLAECISSFYGGALLGILAYRTKSIYGGVIVHLGIALSMELVGWYMRFGWH